MLSRCRDFPEREGHDRISIYGWFYPESDHDVAGMAVTLSEYAMPDGQLNLTNQKLKTPRACLAGILFTVLLRARCTLGFPFLPIRRTRAWLRERAGTVSLALSLLPFAGSPP
jgi:hypothetical protein